MSSLPIQDDRPDSLVHSDPDGVFVPISAADGPAAQLDWTEAAEGLCLTVEKRIEATARKAAEELYSALLYDTQDYLRDNTRLNLQGEIDSGRAEAGRAREALNAVAKAAGTGVQNYYADTAERAVRAIERDRARAKLVPDLLEAAKLVRMSFGWHHLSDETKAVVESAIANATGEA